MYPFWKYALHRRLPRLHILDEDMAGRMGRMFAHASVRNWYVFGLRLVRIWTFPRLRSVEIFGLPLIQIRQHACKTCWCLGPFEILKLRVSGPRSGISQTGRCVWDTRGTADVDCTGTSGLLLFPMRFPASPESPGASCTV